MKKTDKSFGKSPVTGQAPINSDHPIIHHDDPEPVNDVGSFTDLPEKIHEEWTDAEQVTTTVYYKELKITSPAFKNNSPIPSRYTCDGSNVNPPLDIENIPPEAKCLVLIVDDPDAPGGTFVHWLVWNMPISHHIKEGEVHGIQGVNDFKKNQYKGPCPPSGTHHYHFKIYALTTLLNLPAETRKENLEKAMGKDIIAFGEIVGTYQRKR